MTNDFCPHTVVRKVLTPDVLVWAELELVCVDDDECVEEVPERDVEVELDALVLEDKWKVELLE